MKLLKPEWDDMSTQERIDATTEHGNDMKENREKAKTAGHNVPIAVFHDARGTLTAMTREVSPSFCSTRPHY